MPGLTAEARNAMLEALRQEITHFSLHNGDPGNTGDNEVSGGGYERQSASPASFNTPTAGEMTLANDVEFDGTPEDSVTYLGLWEESNFLGGKLLTGDDEFNSEGKFLITEATKISLTNAV